MHVNSLASIASTIVGNCMSLVIGGFACERAKEEEFELKSTKSRQVMRNLDICMLIDSLIG